MLLRVADTVKARYRRGTETADPAFFFSKKSAIVESPVESEEAEVARGTSTEVGSNCGSV